MSDSLDKYIKLFKQVQQEHESGQSNSHPDDRILLIDGHNLFIRVFSAVPTLNDNGDHIGGMAGFLKSLGSMSRQFRPTRIIVVFDGKGGSARRRKIYSSYKEGRSVKFSLNRVASLGQSDDDEMISMRRQFVRLADYLRQMPITIITVDNIEADDVIGYLCNSYFNKEHQKITVVSSDRDFLQLVNNNVSVWSPTKKLWFGPQEVISTYGIPSHNFVLYRTFLGDKSDNIEGIRGIGEKTIKKKLPILLSDKILTVDDLLEYCELNKTDKTCNKILEAKEVLHLNYKLMQLRDVDIALTLKNRIEQCVSEPINTLNKLEFIKMFTQDKMFTSIPDLNSWMSTSFSSLNAYALMSIQK